MTVDNENLSYVWQSNIGQPSYEQLQRYGRRRGSLGLKQILPWEQLIKK